MLARQVGFFLFIVDFTDLPINVDGLSFRIKISRCSAVFQVVIPLQICFNGVEFTLLASSVVKCCDTSKVMGCDTALGNEIEGTGSGFLGELGKRATSNRTSS